MNESAIQAFAKSGITAEQCMKGLYVIVKAMPEDLIRVLEAEVKRRSSFMYRIRRRLPWCKEFFLSK